MGLLSLLLLGLITGAVVLLIYGLIVGRRTEA